MNRRDLDSRSPWLGAVVAAAAAGALLTASDADAGKRNDDVAAVRVDPDGSGTAVANLGATRASPDSEAFAECYTINEHVSAASGGCVVRGLQSDGTFATLRCGTEDPGMVAALRLLSGQSGFEFDVDEDGECTRLVVHGASSDRPLWIAERTGPAPPPPPPPDPRDVAFESFEDDVWPALSRCTSCHSEWSTPGSAFADFYDGASAMRSGACNGRPLVVRGAPEMSVLVDRISGISCGRQMPPSGARLSPAQITTIENWIRTL